MKRLTNLLVVLGLVPFLVAGCGEKKTTAPPAKQVKPAAETPDQEAWNSTVITTKMGHITAKVKYGHMSRYSDKQLMKFDEGVKVFIYDKKGRLSSTVISDRGLLNEKTELVEALGHVVAHSDSGATLYTDHLTYDHKKNKLYTDAFVKVTTKTDTLYGTGFESDENLKHWVIRKPRGVSSRPAAINVESHFRGKKQKQTTAAIKPSAEKTK
ncbi:MAG: LPS export ABC transporter periplasmic protein LptC [Calditrichaeota bacterium]|nr:LPS export ABC transporter periplasmic protein LptC [Calditrichota bacterium]